MAGKIIFNWFFGTISNFNSGILKYNGEWKHNGDFTTGAADEKVNKNAEKIKNCIKIIEFIFTKINSEQNISNNFDQTLADQ